MVTPKTERSCLQCEKQFTPVRSDARFCGKGCSNNYYRKATKKTCLEPGCDKKYLARGMCVVHWNRWARANGLIKGQPWNDRRRANQHRRRAVTLGLQAEFIKPGEVYERDSWSCGICGKPIDQGAVYPNPESASLDHVIPISLGGAHLLSNVQAAHLACNLRKGNRIEMENAA